MSRVGRQRWAGAALVAMMVVPLSGPALAGIPVLDIDGDGVADLDDNCLFAANAGQQDSDGDNIGDKCDEIVAELKTTGNVNVEGFQPLGVAGVDSVLDPSLVQTFQIVLQRINYQRQERLHIGFIESSDDTYRRIAKARLKGWPQGLVKTAVLALPGVQSMSAGDVIVVTKGAPEGNLLSKKRGYFRNSIMAGKLKKR